MRMASFFFKLPLTAVPHTTPNLTTLSCFTNTTSLNFTPSFSFSSRFRCNGSEKLQLNQSPSSFIVRATNPYSHSESGKKKSLNNGGQAQGPPLLTILAGFFIFFLVCWTIASILMWLFTLILNAPPPK